VSAKSIGWFFTSLLWISCSQQAFESGDNSRKASQSDTDAVPYTQVSSATPANESSPSGLSSPVNVIPDPITNANLTSEEADGLISTEPSVAPSIIAGASLTCQRGVPKTDVTCQVTSKGVLTDVVPKHIYVIKGKAAKWIAKPFKRIQVGTYTLSVDANLPESFGMGLTYGVDQYLVTMVGDNYPEYNDLIRDGGFDAIPLDSGAGSTSRISRNDLLSANSPWLYEVRQGQSTCQFDENDSLLDVRNLNRAGSNFAQRKTVYLDTSCPSGGGLNLFLLQGLKVETTHIYRIYAKYKASALPAAGAASQNLQIGIGQNTVAAIFVNIPYRDTEWHLAQVSIKPDVKEPYFFATESGIADKVGYMIDDVKFFDLGIPNLD
jgi:hypothetical protein